MATIVKAYCKKGKCKVGWRECQLNSYLVNERNKPNGNFIQHDSGTTQWICKKQEKLQCNSNDCKNNVFIPLKQRKKFVKEVKE
jgi:hypothetical protein